MQVDKTVMPVESGGLVVFRINHKRENGYRRAQRTRRRIRQQSAAKAAPLERRIHRKAADTRGGNGWITGQASNRFVRKVAQQDMAGGQRIETGNARAFPFPRNETGCQTPPNVLGNLRSKVAVERFYTTRKIAALMTLQPLDNEGKIIRQGDRPTPYGDGLHVPWQEQEE